MERGLLDRFGLEGGRQVGGISWVLGKYFLDAELM